MLVKWILEIGLRVVFLTEEVQDNGTSQIPQRVLSHILNKRHILKTKIKSNVSDFTFSWNSGLYWGYPAKIRNPGTTNPKVHRRHQKDSVPLRSPNSSQAFTLRNLLKRYKPYNSIWFNEWGSVSRACSLTNSKTFVKYVGELLHGCATNSIFRHVLYCNSQNIIVFCTCGHQPLSWVFIIYFFFFLHYVFL